VADTGPGGFCGSTAECQSGLVCVDNVCCTTSCNGTCQACDLPGFEGTCQLIPDGVDPDAECGLASCAAWYWGWTGDTCYRRADVSVGQSSCGGDGACRTATEECSLQTLQGPAALTCHPTCQDPNTGTCSGQTAGSCLNVNPGTQSCGNGVCRVTVPICENGAPKACVPNGGAASTETCNDVDDNCDGLIDNGAFSDSREPNGSCASVNSLPGIGSGQTQTVGMVTIYGQGDNDYYKIHASETDSSCECCNWQCTDEDYRLSVTLAVPVGAGSYILCTQAGVCNDSAWGCTEVLAGTSATRFHDFDGACPDGDSYDLFVRVYGDNGPAYECLPYTLTYSFTPGCF
jgi:hypothetical protein